MMIRVTLLAAAITAGAATPVRWTPAAIATDRYESSAVFTPDGQTMFFVSADKQFRGWRIMQSRCVDGSWDAPTNPPFAAANGVIEADPFVTADGKRLYYISSRHDPAAEDFDIYYVDRRSDGMWSEPNRLPAPVNTGASELLPRIDAAGQLYFGSDRPGGFGQSDIYIATQDSHDGWSVRNAGAPISTPANEYEAEISSDGRMMVLVADRGERSHLYLYRMMAGRWAEKGQMAAKREVFQVGPKLSPRGERLLFAQADGEQSGEMFVVDMVPSAIEAWPPRC